MRRPFALSALVRHSAVSLCLPQQQVWRLIIRSATLSMRSLLHPLKFSLSSPSRLVPQLPWPHHALTVVPAFVFLRLAARPLLVVHQIPRLVVHDVVPPRFGLLSEERFYECTWRTYLLFPALGFTSNLLMGLEKVFSQLRPQIHLRRR